MLNIFGLIPYIVKEDLSAKLLHLEKVIPDAIMFLSRILVEWFD